ncbi:signal peptidase I [Halobacteriales archaeon QH_10_67_13]|nr:MAG: signal peptidase I [Halobacteriales archaeon QH_10_67_13]
MSVRTRAASALVWVLVLVVTIALVSDILIGQPALLGYVESGSMTPTLSTGDGYVPIPAILAGEITEGDVITFESSQIEGGQPTTHRVVSVTGSGYVTKGDANTVTDQDSGAPPVTDAQVTAVALQVNGGVVRIPGLGTGVGLLQGLLSGVQAALGGLFGTTLFSGERGLAVTLFGLGAALLVVEFVAERRGRPDRTRSRSRFSVKRVDSRLLIGGLAVLLMLVATVGMLAPAGTTSFELISAESDAETPRVTAAGGTTERPFVSENGGLVPLRVFVEPASEGIEVPDQRVSLGRGESHEQRLRTSVPEEIGLYQRSVTEYRYFAVLPTSVIDTLHDIHPTAALLAVNLVIGGVVTLVGVAVVGTGSLRVRERSRDGSKLFGLFNDRTRK